MEEQQETRRSDGFSKQEEVRMAEIFPFRAYRYNAARVHPAEVLTQPYDKITPAMAEKYAAASPYNLISVEKGKALPGDTPGSDVHTRTHTGQLFMLYSDAAARVDALLDAAARGTPEVEVRDEYEVAHRLWPVTNAKVIETIQNEMADKKLVIADGHHRYETALAYRDECRARDGRVDRNAPYEKVMMTLFNTMGKGLTILPTHRVVANVTGFSFERFRTALADAFDWNSYPFGSAADRTEAYKHFRSDLMGRGKKQRAIGVYAGGGSFYLCLLKKEADLQALLPGISAAQRQLDVVLLHRLILERGLGITPDAVKTEKNMTYEREMDTAIAEVDQARAQICFLLNSVSVETVAGMAMAGEVLPQKSTDFFPKLMSGITMYRLEE